jgi:ABC-type phosphate transport system auxiliary subunit
LILATKARRHKGKSYAFFLLRYSATGQAMVGDILRSEAEKNLLFMFQAIAKHKNLQNLKPVIFATYDQFCT